MSSMSTMLSEKKQIHRKWTFVDFVSYMRKSPNIVIDRETIDVSSYNYLRILIVSSFLEILGGGFVFITQKLPRKVTGAPDSIEE